MAVIVKKLQWQKQNIISEKDTLQALIAETNRDEDLIVQHWVEFQPSLNDLKTIASELFDNDVDITDELKQFRGDYLKIKSAVSAIQAATQAVAVHNGRQLSNSKEVKLPVVELPTFSGKYDEWQGFRDEFTSLIHDNLSLGNVQKFHYLRSSLKGEAAQMLKTIQMSDASYDTAWTLLKKRYQNERFIIKRHVQALIHLPAVKKDNLTSLRQLIDLVALNLAALKSINRKTDDWDDLLVELVAEKLDTDLQSDWEGETCNKVPTYAEMEAYLTKKSQKLEAMNKFRTTSNQQLRVKSFAVQSNEQKCVFCAGDHSRYKCNVFLSKTVDERVELVRAKNLCYNCLGNNHTTKTCKSSNCRECNKRHHSLLHINRETNQQKSAASVSNLAYSPSNVLLSTCVLQLQDTRGKTQHIRALLDSGSQANIISSSCVNRLGLKRHSLSAPIIGIGGAQTNIGEMVHLNVQSRLSKFNISIHALIMDKITGNLPNKPIDVRGLTLPTGVQLADPKYCVPAKIDLLIGACHFFDVIRDGRLSMGPLHLINSHFGWIVAGQVPQADNPQASSSATVGFVGINELVSRFWEVENYKQHTFTGEDRKCEQPFKSTVSRDSTGRFEVALPFRENAKPLGNSSISARNRFFALERRLAKQPDVYEAYREFMREYLQLEHMHPITGDITDGYYMPHHCVIKNESLTTKLRVVFDASAPSSTGVSLNDTLMIGPSLQEDLFSIITRMRVKKYVITADITKMYRQIEIRETDRKYQRIWWRERPQDKLISYELATVTYGTAPAAYLAIRSVRELANIESHNYPVGSKVCLNDFYVDDLITGANSIEELIVIRDQVSALLKKGGFELKKWASNNNNVFECFHTDNRDPVTILTRDFSESVTTLGSIWNTKCDTLAYKCSEIATRVISKRSILSEISRIYDPLGLIGPIIITAKILIQDLWKLKCGWDDPLSAPFLDRWNLYSSKLPQVREITVPRYVLFDNDVNIELHGFADASEKAYGACIYVVSVKDNTRISSQLLCAKSRVAPVQALTIPRLELSAALLLAELCDRVCSAIDVKITRRVFYSDSTITLSWIKSESRNFKTFVANRVGEIQRLSDPEDWHHASTHENPADLISRGLTPAELLESSLWWHGPEFLKKAVPATAFEPVTDLPEIKCCVATFPPEDNLIPTYSSFRKTVRIIAYVLRFKNPAVRKGGPLTVEELNHSTITIIRYLQATAFGRERELLVKGKQVQRSSTLVALNPLLDDNGLIRVGGRLMKSDLPLSRRCPIVLPNKHNLTKLIIRDTHEKQLHAGTQATLAEVRMKYWPLKGRSITREIVRNCVKCIRAKPHSSTPIMGSLPAYRTQAFRPFLKCGVDYCGPFTIKEGSRRSRKTIKVYICVFVCFATKATHIEPVADLTTEAFLAAFYRLISRRGCIAEIFSDNATNFVGARNHLRELGHLLVDAFDNIRTALASQGIKWTFIPPRAPHFGGLWEAAVKSIKHHLHRVAGNALLTYTEFHTLITQIEGVLNSRPLCTLSEDPNDMSALTPGHFLIGDAITAPVCHDYSDLPDNRLARWQYVEKLRQHIWRRWQKEYLSELQKRNKWQQNGALNLDVGRVVIIREDNLPPLQWRLARIEAIHPGSDGVARSATVRTSSGSFVRPVVKLCPLSEIDRDN